MKRILGLFISFTIVMGSLSLLSLSYADGGFTHPPEAFKLFKVEQCKSSSSVDEYIGAVNDVVKLYESFSMCSDVSSVLAPRYKRLALKYMEKKEYKNAYECIKKHRDLTEKRMKNYGFSEMDNLIDADKLINVLDYEPKLYAFTKNSKHRPCYGALGEMAEGVFFGRPSKMTKDIYDDSACLVYVEFGENDISDFEYLINQRQNEAKILELAWNFPEEMKTCDKIIEGCSDGYIIDNLKYLNTLKMPIILRIGAEQNAWTTTDPEKFKAAYIRIANAARTHAPKVALAFSVNYIGSRDYTYRDFYPGDRYVDWVGVSLYLNKFFSKENESDLEMMCHGVGKYADPVILMKPIVEEFGSHKPIFIAESASGYKFRPTGRDLTDFSVSKTEQLFAALPMVYPQIKGIIHFDTDVKASRYNYKISGNQRVEEKYDEITGSLPVYKKNIMDATGYYTKLEKYSDKLDDKLYLGSYLNSVLYPNVTASYYLNGVLVNTVRSNPAVVSIDKDRINLAENELRVVFTVEGGKRIEKKYRVFRGNGDVVSVRAYKSSDAAVSAIPSRQKVMIDGKPVSFEAYNIGGNNFFKLRDVACALMSSDKKFSVNWNSEKKLIAIHRESDYVKNGSELIIPKKMEKQRPVSNSAKLELNGREISVSMYNIKGNNFVKLRNIGQLIDFGIDYNSKKKVIEIETGDDYQPE